MRCGLLTKLTGGYFYNKIYYRHRPLKRGIKMENWPERIKKLEKIIKSAPQYNVRIRNTHCDLDVMACNSGVIRLFNYYGKTIDVISNHEPKREQEKLVAKLYGLRYRPIDEKIEYPFTILLDAPSAGANITPNIIVDHHELSGDGAKTAPAEDENSWHWRAPYGACSSMIGKLLLDFNVPFEKHDEIATQILLGIFLDTSNLTSVFTKDLDRQIVAELGKFADQETVHLVSSSTFNPEFLRLLHIATAKKNCVHNNTTMVVCLGEKMKGCDEFETYMVKIANMFLKITDISMVYVWAIWSEQNQVVVKARNSNLAHEPGWFSAHLKKVLKTEDAGAKHNAEGGANIDMGPGGATRKRKMLIRIWRDIFENSLLG